MNFSFKRAEDSPGFLLWQLTNQWQRRQRRALTKLGLTHGQFVVLAGVLWLSAIPDNVVTQRQVAEFTKIDKMSMSDLAATLVEKKLLRRFRQKQDRRAYSLLLTEKGRERILKAVPVVEGIDAAFFTAQTPQVGQLLIALKHLA
jgi:DNA-binding MarR family transcriptional regulator